MKSLKFLILTSLVLIFSCSNLGEQSEKELKVYRSGNAFNSVLDEVLKEDKAFAEIVDLAAERYNNRGDQISINSFKSSGASPEYFINSFYQNALPKINMIIDSSAREELVLLYQANEGIFQEKLAEKVLLQKQISELNSKLQQEILRLKIKKTLAYMENYQSKKTIDVSELITEKEKLEQLINNLSKI